MGVGGLSVINVEAPSSAPSVLRSKRTRRIQPAPAFLPLSLVKTVSLTHGYEEGLNDNAAPRLAHDT